MRVGGGEGGQEQLGVGGAGVAENEGHDDLEEGWGCLGGSGIPT